MRYVGVAYDPREAGHALEVDAVLDGKIQRAGDRVRVTVQLIRVRDGAPLWAGTFDEQSGDIFAVEDSISEQVLTALNFKLSREEQGRLRRRQTDNAEAAQAHAEGSLAPAELRFDPRLDNLRATAAFQDFARRVGLPQCGLAEDSRAKSPVSFKRPRPVSGRRGRARSRTRRCRRATCR